MKFRQVVGLLSGTIAVLVGSIAVSFAWFYEGSSARVNSISMTLRGEKELFISTTGEEGSFKEMLSKDELIKVDSFSPVSSINSEEWINEKASMPRFRTGYSGAGENPATGLALEGYYSQELYLYSEDNVYATIDTSDESFMFVANAQRNEEIYNNLGLKEQFPLLTKEEIIDNLNKVANSLRVSILIPDEENYSYTIIDPYKEGDTMFAGLLDADSSGYFDTYTKGGIEYETCYGNVADRTKLVYDEPQSTPVKTNNLLTCFDANHKANTKLLNIERSIENGAGFAIENSISKQDVESNLKIPLHAYVPTKIVLSLYLEGWDLDNTNLVRYASFLTTIKFKILKEMF